MALASPVAAQTTLRLGHSLAKGHPVDVSLQEFAALVSERSGGDMEIKVFPAGQLGQQRELIEQMQNGAIDLVHANASPLAAFEPSYGVYDMPFLFRDTEHFFSVVEGPVGEADPAVEPAQGVRRPRLLRQRHAQLLRQQAAAEAEDLNGLKVRVQPGPIATRMVDLMGATATPLPWGEVYTALQSGVVDAAENNVTALTLARHGEVMKVYTRTEHTRVPDVLLIATIALDQLTPEQQALLRQAARDSATAHNARWKAELEKAENEAATKMGVTFVDADRTAYRQVVEPMYADLKAILMSRRSPIRSRRSSDGEEHTMLRTIHRTLDAIVLAIAIPLMVVMLGCVVWQVVARYALSISTSTTDEISRFAFIWISLLGATYVLGKRGHIAITGLVDLLPARPRGAVEVAIVVLVAVFAVAVLAGGGWLLVERAFRLGQVTPALQIPMWMVYAVLPLSGVLTLVYTVLAVLETLRGEEVERHAVSLD